MFDDQIHNRSDEDPNRRSQRCDWASDGRMRPKARHYAARPIITTSTAAARIVADAL